MPPPAESRSPQASPRASSPRDSAPPDSSALVGALSNSYNVKSFLADKRPGEAKETILMMPQLYALCARARARVRVCPPQLPRGA